MPAGWHRRASGLVIPQPGLFSRRVAGYGGRPFLQGRSGLPGAAGRSMALTTQPSTSATSASALAQQPVLQLTPAANNVVVTASLLTGSGTINAGGTATSNSSGVATFSGLAITGSGPYRLGFSADPDGYTPAQASADTEVSGGGGFSTPDILNAASFEDGSGTGGNGWSTLTDGDGGTPSGVTRSTTQAYLGSKSAKVSWNNVTTDDQHAHLIKEMASGQSHVFARFYFYVETAWPNGPGFKFFRWQDAGYNNLHGIQALDGYLIYVINFPPTVGPIARIMTLPSVGAWHWIEFEVDNGAKKSRVWVDGTPRSFTEYYDPTNEMSVGGSGNTELSWTTAFTARNLDIFRLINAGTGNAGALYGDNVSISTTQIGA